MANILTQFAAIWKKLGVNQKAMILMMIGGLIAGIVALVMISRRSSYELLYADVDEKDMARLVSFLKESKVPFQVGGAGRSIMVAEGSKYDVQAQLISSDLTPQSGHTGLESYNPSALASTPQQERMLKRRALQGELSRVLNHIEHVEWADVQIALGDEGGLLGDEANAKAAITLRLRGGYTLKPTQIEGMRQLVANAIQGLEPKNVSLIDDTGVLLSPAQDNTAATQASSRQSYRQMVEQELAAKAQALLDNTLGKGKSTVRVTAILNMDLKDVTMESFNADGTYTRIEKMSEETTEGTGGKTTSEVEKVAPKTLTHTRSTPGAITRLHIALALDPNYTDKDDKAAQYTAEEIKQLEDIVKAAVGFDTSRNDTFSKTVIAFRKEAAPTGPPEEAESRASQDYILQIARHSSPVVAVVIFMVFAFVVLKKITKQQKTTGRTEETFFATMPGNASAGQGDNDNGAGAGPSLSSAAQTGLRNRVKDIIDKDPSTAARLLQTWLEE